jgi:thiamine biosynthesis lipoprotein
MGTVLEVTLRAADEPAGRALLDRLYARTADLEAELSSWQPDSSLSRLNAAAGTGPQPVAPELAALLREALPLSARTEGSFDVSVGPLVALWKEAGRRGRLPSAEELASARAKVGAQLVELSGERVALAKRGMSIDLGGVAKGHALDRLAALLRAEGVADALLSFGESSIVALGAPEGGGRWRLLVRGPTGAYVGVVGLRDQALSVSGSLGQFEEIGGRRFGHVIDPRSGMPAQDARVALVLAPTAAAAEGWSKALLVLGPERGLALAEAEPGVEALLLAEDRGRAATSGFDESAAFEALRSAGARPPKPARGPD